MILRPIKHKDAYTQAVEVVLMQYFDEAIFGPLFSILKEARVPEDLARRELRENAREFAPFPPELRSLGVPRRAMPQIHGDDHTALILHLADLGVPSRIRMRRAMDLRPSQAEFVPSKVEAAISRGRPGVILASRDDYVLDGHHRWFAAYLTNPKMHVETLEFDGEARALVAQLATFRDAYRENSTAPSPLKAALDSGRLWYADGAFYGETSAQVARDLRALGATYDASQRAFLISSDKLPYDVRTAVVSSLDRSKAVHGRVEEFLASAETNVRVAVSGIEVDQVLSVIRGDLYRQWDRALQAADVKAIDVVEVAPDFTPEIEAAIAEDFTENLDLYVKNFLAHEIPEMRELVKKNAYAGWRSDKLAEEIAARYGVTKRKAAFLADQETGLLVSKYREEKAKSVGAVTYKWSTSHDERVRPDHRLLNGKVFSFDSPPVTNLKTGARNNPGEDFRCRCVPMPILDFGAAGSRANSKEFRCARDGAALTGSRRCSAPSSPSTSHPPKSAPRLRVWSERFRRLLRRKTG